MSQLSEQTLFLENEIAKIHDTLPHLPLQWREFLRNIIPWLTLIGGIMGSIGLLSMARMYTSPFGQLIGMYGQISTLLIVNTLIMIVSTALYFIAFPKLKNQEKGGWNMIFWASLISIIGGVLGGFALGQIIGALIGIYLLFEIRSYFK